MRNSPTNATRRRALIRAVTCLLAGAVLTWAVAWASALWMCNVDHRQLMEAEKPAIPAWPRRDWSPDMYSAATSITCDDVIWIQNEPVRALRLRTFGVPVRSLAQFWTEAHDDQVDSSLQAPAWLFPSARCGGLPVNILPLGFALDALLYAGVVLGVVELAGSARRRRRRAKSLCLSCGYDRRGLAGEAACPECGGKQTRRCAAMPAP